MVASSYHFTSVKSFMFLQVDLFQQLRSNTSTTLFQHLFILHLFILGIQIPRRVDFHSMTTDAVCFDPCHEKNFLMSFPPGKTQTQKHRYLSWENFRLLIASWWVPSSPGVWCCVLEQNTSSQLVLVKPRKP